MEKIDWKNLSYHDFIGFVAVTAFCCLSCISEGFGMRLMITGYR